MSTKYSIVYIICTISYNAVECAHPYPPVRISINTKVALLYYLNLLDSQTSADVGNVASFQLPDAAGKAGGALTSAMLSVIYKEETPSAKDLTFVDVFLRAKKVVKAKGFDQIPQLSSSRNIDVNQPFDLMSNSHGNKGTRYAVLIGINYTTHKQGRLSGCHNDVANIRKYIMDVGKFQASNITILLVVGKAMSPTRVNIMKALDELCKKVGTRISIDMDSCYVYSPHS